MLQNPPTPASVSDLLLYREKGDGSRKRVNRFLEHVGHKLGGVPHWKAAWTARYRDHIVSAIVLNRPAARMVDDEKEIVIQRFAAVPNRPDNTGSWLIARARKWAELEGYERIAAHAGVAGNEGTVYKAAGFVLEGARMADGSGWQSREGRDSWEDYERRKFVYHFDNNSGNTEE